MLIEARQQLALVLPMWCTLWLAAATWMGRPWALPWLVLAASFVLQTHFTYAYQTVAVAGAATIAFAVRHRGDLASVVRPMIRRPLLSPRCAGSNRCGISSFGTGNAGDVLGQSGGSERSVGVSRGLRILAESAFVPPFFAPGSMGDLLREGPRPVAAASPCSPLQCGRRHSPVWRS